MTERILQINNGEQTVSASSIVVGSISLVVRTFFISIQKLYNTYNKKLDITFESEATTLFVNQYI